MKYIGPITVVCLIGAISFYYLSPLIRRSQTKKETAHQEAGPTGAGSWNEPREGVPPGDRFIIHGPYGDVSVNNFYPTAQLISQEKQTVTLVENEQFGILFYTSDSSFVVTLNSKPFGPARKAAEKTFLEKVGVSKVEACKLMVVEGVPQSATNTFIAVDIKLSFCPYAVQLKSNE